MSFRHEPRDHDGHVARFRKRLRALWGPRMRVRWDPYGSAISSGARGRWVIEELGHVSGLWQHVWHVEGPGGCYRDLGDWIFERLREMDRMCALSGLMGLKKLSDVTWGPRIDQARRATGAKSELFYAALDKARFYSGERRSYPAVHIPSAGEAAFRALPRRQRRKLLAAVRGRLRAKTHGAD